MASKEAAAYLRDQLNLAEAEVQGLESAIAAYQAKMEGVRLKILALRGALAGIGEPLVEPSKITGEAATPLVLRTAKFDEDIGIRGAIRITLRDAKKPLRPRDLLQELHNRGFIFTGKVPPATRLSTELWRMAKTGQIQKRGSEYFIGAKSDLQRPMF